jgi:hypothetical protein
MTVPGYAVDIQMKLQFNRQFVKESDNFQSYNSNNPVTKLLKVNWHAETLPNSLTARLVDFCGRLRDDARRCSTVSSLGRLPDLIFLAQIQPPLSKDL